MFRIATMGSLVAFTATVSAVRLQHELDIQSLVDSADPQQWIDSNVQSDKEMTNLLSEVLKRGYQSESEREKLHSIREEVAKRVVQSLIDSADPQHWIESNVKSDEEMNNLFSEVLKRGPQSESERKKLESIREEVAKRVVRMDGLMSGLLFALSKKATERVVDLAQLYGELYGVNSPLTNGQSVMHNVAEVGLTDAIEPLMEKGAKIDIKGDNMHGNSPLQVSLFHGNFDTALRFLDLGADATHIDNDDRMTTLMATVKLLENEAEISVREKKEAWFEQQGYKIIDELITKGANILAEDANRKTILDHAEWNKNLHTWLSNRMICKNVMLSRRDPLTFSDKITVDQYGIREKIGEYLNMPESHTKFFERVKPQAVGNADLSNAMMQKSADVDTREEGAESEDHRQDEQQQQQQPEGHYQPINRHQCVLPQNGLKQEEEGEQPGLRTAETAYHPRPDVEKAEQERCQCTIC